MKKYNLDDLNTEYSNQRFGLLVVNRVFRDSRIGIACECKCDCGNIKIAALRKLKSGHVRSCGCYSKSESFSKKMSDICKDSCLKLDISKKVSDWYRNNPDKVKEKAEKFSQWCKDNCEKIEEISNKNSEWCKNNPDKVKDRGNKIRQFYRDNPQVSKDIAEKNKLFYELHKDKVEDIANKCRQWRKSNPEKILDISKKVSDWYRNNPDKVKERTIKSVTTFHKNREANSKSMLKCHIDKRLSQTNKLDLSFIHPDDIHFILDGANSSTKVRTKCPICGEYSYHRLYSFINYSNSTVIEIPVCGSHSISKPENEIFDYISNIYSGEAIRRTRKVIPPLELDLYYPEKKIAVEFNGDYWHSEQHGISRDYHFKKFKLCRDNNVRLISIFECDWKHRKHKVLQLLDDIFKSTSRIYARDCSVKSINYKEASSFLNKYHFDGGSKQYSISYGLFYNEELVSCMSFGKIRGQNSMRIDCRNYELVRSATKSNLLIVGGLSKLFSIFISEHSPNYVICYSDNDFFSGESYRRLGFELNSFGERCLDYYWCNSNTFLTRHNCMPCKLIKKYPEYSDIEIHGSKEKYIMEDLGFMRVYRCGNSKWEWRSALS